MYFALFVLTTLSLQASAASPSAEEIALRNAITSSSAASYSLTEDIFLTQDLPPLPDNKTLAIRSANIPGAPFKIDGQNKYLIFRSAVNAVVTLALSSIILTHSPLAVDIGREEDFRSQLTVSKVQFINNGLGIQLGHTKTLIDSSLFHGHTRSAVRNIDTANDLISNELKIVKCTFTNNTEPDSSRGGGALQLSIESFPTIERTKFFGNSAAGNGGAVWLSEIFLTVKTSLCEFSNNRAGGFGGVIYMFESSVYDSSSTFKKNVAAYGGGAIYNVGFTSLKLSKFINNKSLQPTTTLSTGGGAVYFASTFDNPFCRCTFSGNTAGGKPNNIFIPDYTVIDFIGMILTNPPVNIPLVVLGGGDPPFTNGTGFCR